MVARALAGPAARRLSGRVQFGICDEGRKSKFDHDGVWQCVWAEPDVHARQPRYRRFGRRCAVFAENAARIMEDSAEYAMCVRFRSPSLSATSLGRKKQSAGRYAAFSMQDVPLFAEIPSRAAGRRTQKGRRRKVRCHQPGRTGANFAHLGAFVDLHGRVHLPSTLRSEVVRG